MVSADNKADLASGPLVIDRSHVMGRQVAPDFRLACSRLMALLTSEEKRRGLILTLSILFNGWLNILGISILVPFIYLVVSEDPLDGENLIARALRFLNFRDEAAAIFWVGIAILLLSVVKNAYGLFHRRAIDLFCANVELRLTSECVKLIAQAPYSWFSARNTTVLRELALGHVAEFTRSVLRMLLQLGSDLAILGFSVAFVLIVNPVAGLIVTVSVAFVGVALVWACRSRVFKGAEEKRLHARRALLYANDAIMGGRDVRMSRADGLLARAFAEAQHAFGVAAVKTRFFAQLPRSGMEVVGVSTLVIFTLALLISGLPKKETAEILLIFGLIAVRSIPIVSQAIASISHLWSALPVIGELHDFHSTLTEVSPIRRSVPGDFHGWSQIAITNAGYRYPDADKSALVDVNLVIARGERIGVVGPSGAGKSTLIDIIVGLLEPEEGQVCVDTRTLDADAAASWRLQVGYVAQLPYLVDGTLLDNVVLGAEMSEDVERRCLESLNLAGLSDLVASLPNGIYSRVGDFGAQLSGGQRQRVAIARALYRDTSLLVLDEATSALDSRTEQDVIGAIFKLNPPVTAIIIAHRLSTVRHCDRIVVISDGRVVGLGTHPELMESSDVYRELTKTQFIDT